MFGKDADEDLEFVSYIHDAIIDASGGVKGFHNEGLVRSALARPFQSAFNKNVHETDTSKAAAMLFSLANNHGFRDGNKRTAMAAAVIFLNTKGVDVEFTNREYEEFMLYVVNEKPKIEEIAKWLSDHSRQR